MGEGKTGAVITARRKPRRLTRDKWAEEGRGNGAANGNGYVEMDGLFPFETWARYEYQYETFLTGNGDEEEDP